MCAGVSLGSLELCSLPIFYYVQYEKKENGWLESFHQCRAARSKNEYDPSTMFEFALMLGVKEITNDEVLFCTERVIELDIRASRCI